VKDSPPSILRLILWPTLVTLLVNAARLVAEQQGWSTTVSGGAGFWLGITWLAFVFGGWFGWRLRRAGSTPTLRPAWVWSLVALLAIAGTAVWQFSQIDLKNSSPDAMPPLRSAVLTIVAVAIPMALLQFVVWRRLAAAMLLYGLVARATVVGLTWLAKSNGWDTHYTKFGPGGIQVDMNATMVSATIAQFGFWVSFTIVGGVLAGAIVAGRRAAA
jgi:hypothetical protein